MLKIDDLKRKKINVSFVGILILVLVLICAFVLFFEIKDYKDYKKIKEDFYYYFAGSKIDFNATITLDSDDKILSIESNNLKLNEYPIFYKDEDKMILPKNMELIYPYKSKPMYKVGAFSQIYYKGSYIFISSEFGDGRLYDSFLYDGDNLYVFIEPTVVVVDGVNYSLVPMSYVVIGNKNIGIYNKEKNEYITVKNNNPLYAYTDEYAINLTDKMYEYKSIHYSLIKNVDALEPINF